MSDYVGVAWTLVLGLLGIVTVHIAGRASTVHRIPIVSLPFLSGHGPAEHALSRFHARWYPMTLLFLAFDVEMLFMYPWALVVLQEGLTAVVEMFLFLGVLLVGVLWVWREGALRWS